MNTIDNNIERAIEEAKARKASRTEKKPRLTPEQRAERVAMQERLRADKQAERQARREARKGAVVHMTKVDKAGAKLPTLTDQATEMFNDATTGLTRVQIAALTEHLRHFNRVAATRASLDVALTEGMQITVTAGESRFYGKTGTVIRVQRIHCYVEIDGKEAYLFSSDVEPVIASSSDQIAI